MRTRSEEQIADAIRSGASGAFVFYPGEEREIRAPNTIVAEGEKSFLQMLLQGDNTIVAAAANFYLGLCGLAFGDQSTTLSTLAGEPAVSNGYARQAISRDTTGWPSGNLVQVNGIWKAATKIINFTASGGDFSVAIQRAFLCSVSAGSSGKLFAVGGQLSSPITVTSGTSLPAQYELYLR